MADPMATNPRNMDRKAMVSSLLRTVLLCDWVDSTQLIDTLGDKRAVELLQTHDQFLRDTLAITQGRLIDKADGVLALFERPIQALDFALRYQQQMRLWGKEYQQAIQARIGIHVGDVMTWQNEPDQIRAGAKPLEVEGFAKPIAARLMNLAMPGQILMSGMAQSLAQRAQLELGERGQHLRWLVHGRYQFKGVPAPMLVHEVGDPQFSPLRAPTSTQKAWRDIPLWRRPPVVALEVLLSVGLIGGILYTTLQSPPAIAFYERDWVVLGDLQNQTREKMFDDALDTAMRVGLEQSAYVNVISDSQEKDALKRMQREGQTIDRQTGAEIALREGAKAFVLPTIIETGGHFRISAEVIDPSSGVTVYTETAEAKNADKVLPAMDDVLEKLRLRLGEAQNDFKQAHQSLEKVTTPNIEALRAFSLGLKARNESRTSDALALFQEAVKKDPGFALAYLRMGAIMYSDNNSTQALQYFYLAQANRARLTNREALLVDASNALFTTPENALSKWKLLAAMYPDEFRAYYNYSYFAFHDAQRYKDAATFISPALSINNPARASAFYQLGMCELAQDNIASALIAFKQSEELGVTGFKRHHADAFASRRRFAEAKQVLATQTSESIEGLDLEEKLAEISYPLDQGHWSEALQALNEFAEKIEPAPILVKSNYQLLRLSLLSYEPNAGFSQQLNKFVFDRKVALAESDPLYRRHIVFQLMAAGWMAANAGDVDTANMALSAGTTLAREGGYPANSDMLLILKAQLLLREGKSAAAIELLAPRASAGNELYFLHAVLMRAYAADKDFSRALDQADWLMSHRGRAYAESNSNYSWQPANILESHLANQAAIYYAGKLGKQNQARQYQSAFDNAWPIHDRPAWVKRVNN
jgi:putative peptide modification system cyclase